MNSSVIDVGARKYSIALLSDCDFDFLLAKQNIHDDEIKAFIDYDNQFIVVRDKLNKEHKRELVIHELLHALIEDAGIEQNSEMERLIHVLSPRLNEIILSLNIILNDLGLIKS